MRRRERLEQLPPAFIIHNSVERNLVNMKNTVFNYFFISTCLIAIIQIDAFVFSRSFFVGSKRQQINMCTDRQVNPELIELANTGGPRSDSDNLWRTEQSSVIPIIIPKFPGKPAVITFDAYDTLIEPSQSVGRWYREALNTIGDMRLRLPRPAMFTAAFDKAYSDM